MKISKMTFFVQQLLFSKCEMLKFLNKIFFTVRLINYEPKKNVNLIVSQKSFSQFSYFISCLSSAKVKEKFWIVMSYAWSVSQLFNIICSLKPFYSVPILSYQELYFNYFHIPHISLYFKCKCSSSFSFNSKVIWSYFAKLSFIPTRSFPQQQYSSAFTDVPPKSYIMTLSDRFCLVDSYPFALVLS